MENDLYAVDKVVKNSSDIEISAIEELVDIVVPKKKKVLPFIPKKELALLILGKEVINHWIASNYVLEYISIEDYQLLIDTYELKLAESKTTKAERTPTIDRLRKLIDDIGFGVPKIKSKIKIHFDGDSAYAQYPAFGLNKRNGGYKAPAAYDEIEYFLISMLQGLEKYGYNDFEFGKSYWQPIYDEYKALSAKNKALSGNTSLLSADKSEIKERVYEVLNSLLKILEGQKRDKWQQVARSWGYQKERY